MRKIRLKPQGERPQTLYRKIHDVKPERLGNETTHTALIHYNDQEVIVYLINGEWVSYGEVQDQQPVENTKEASCNPSTASLKPTKSGC